MSIGPLADLQRFTASVFTPADRQCDAYWEIRICIDPRDLNKAIKREHFPMRTIEEVISRCLTPKYFLCWTPALGSGRSNLDEESTNLCTFNTPFGRYKFHRLPFGICSAPEVFQDVMSQVFEDLEGIEIVADDILVWGKDDIEHDQRLEQLLQRARDRNVKLNKDKCQLRKPQISYLGHVLTSNGLKPDPEKVRAISEMEPPHDKESLRRFMGMVTYVAKFIPNLSVESAPLRALLGKGVQWEWDETKQKSFQKLKEKITKTPVLKLFDVNKEVTISVDASSQGLGAVLLQEGAPIAYASKSMTKSQQNYAQIEKEMLGIVFGCERFHEYLYGQKSINVETDHKPLEAIFTKPLYQTPHRLQQMLLKVQKYPLSVNYKPGKELYIADTLSRCSLAEMADNLGEKAFEIAQIQMLPMSNEKLIKLRQLTVEDISLQTLVKYIGEGWPETRSELPVCARPYWSYKHEITVNDEILFRGDKVIVPLTKMRRDILAQIHSAHFGIEKCKRRARDVLFWPQMNAEIEDLISKCEICNKYRNQNTKEPLMPHDVPTRPWAKIGADLFEWNVRTTSVEWYGRKGCQIAKGLLTKKKEDGQDPYLALLEYRNTPRDDILGSPAQRLFGRRTKTRLPTSERLLQPRILKPDTVTKRLAEKRQMQKTYFDRQARPLAQLYPGENIRMQTEKGWVPATVTSRTGQPRSYIVETLDGTNYRRNRKHLRKTKENMTH
ncbi:hypothetical protein BSL78_02827 [Apostichopus japonicus]|uniref:Reverse transcriptase domain-containing protein n=1 Tax=Stichopus japonicus TaxID=307972 RepID=A0A2G8LJ59_STIJA|nr:hypothetical protein BSL78_02827 [Apostichopus japonicus]